MTTRVPPASQPAHRPRVALDGLDLRLLRILRDHGRLSVATLAERADTSRAGAYARLQRLTDEGVITGFTASIDSRRAGLDVSTLVLVSCHQPDWKAFAQEVAEIEEIEYCALVSGEYDALLLVRTPDVETLRDVVFERIQNLPSVRSTHTMFVLDEVLRRPFILPPGETPPVVAGRGRHGTRRGSR